MTFIFYVAILLVLLGAFFIYTSLEVRKVVRREEVLPAVEKTVSSAADDLPFPAEDRETPEVAGLVPETEHSMTADAVQDTSPADFNIDLL